MLAKELSIFMGFVCRGTYWTALLIIKRKKNGEFLMSAGQKIELKFSLPSLLQYTHWGAASGIWIPRWMVLWACSSSQTAVWWRLPILNKPNYGFVKTFRVLNAMEKGILSYFSYLVPSIVFTVALYCSNSNSSPK